MGGKKKDPTWAPLNPVMQDYYNQIRNPNPQFQQAQQTLGDTAAGKYLYGGEGFNAALEAAKNKIIPDVESRFARGGRFGGGLNQAAEAAGIGDAFANLYGQERGLQQQAAMGLPSVSNLSLYSPLLSATSGMEPQYPGSKIARTLGSALAGAVAGGLGGRSL